MKILMYHNNPGHLILVDGNTVINGNYTVRKNKEGTYSNNGTAFRATFVKNVQMKSNYTYNDATRVLDDCERELRGKMGS